MARLGRSQPIAPHLPKLGSSQPVGRGAFILQSLQRPYVGRATPRPHLAPPVPAAPFVAPQATIVSAHVLRRPHFVAPPSTILPPPVPFVAAIVTRPTIVSLGASNRPRRLRNSPGTILPQPSPPAPVPNGTFVSQAVRRSLTQRALNSRPHLAPPVSATTFIAPPATIVGSHLLRRRGRSTPPSTILPTPTFLAPVARYATIVSLGAAARPRRLRNVAGTILPPPIAGQPPVAAGTFVSQALRRPLLGRQAARTLRAQPVVAAPVPFRAAGFLFYQAISRALLGRGGHVRLPAPGARPPVPEGTFVSQALRRPYIGRQAAKTLRAAPLVAPAIGFRSAGFLSLQAIARSQERRYRDVVAAPHLAPRVTTPAGPGATIKLQAVQRALIGRGGHVHLPPTPGLGPVPRGTFLGQAVERALVGRGPFPKPHVASAAVSTVPFIAPPALLVAQAVERAQQSRLRSVPKPHLAPRVPSAAGPGATIHLEAVVGRTLLGRNGRVRLPRLGAPQPVPTGTFVSQSLRRPYVGRTTPSPHLARPVPPSTFVAPAALIVSQAIERGWQTRARSVPAPHLAARVTTFAGPGATVKLQSLARQLRRREGRVLLPKIGQATPVPTGTFVSQVLRRPYVGRTVPGPHLAKGIVTPFTIPPVSRGSFVAQSLQRPYVGRTVPKPHLAKSIVSFPPAVTTPTILSQAIKRADYLGTRRGHVRLAPPVLAAARKPPTLVVSQALQRPYYGLPDRGGRVLLPKLGAPRPVRPGTFVYQGLRRPYIGRGPFPPKHLTAPIVKPPAAPISAFPIVHYQAISRMYIGRKVPPSPSLRYHPIVFAPSQPFVPFPSITKTGITKPGRITGTSAPRKTLGTAGLQLGEFALSETTVLNGGFGALGISRLGGTRPSPSGTTTQPSSRTARTVPHAMISRGGLQLGEFILSETSILGGGL